MNKNQSRLLEACLCAAAQWFRNGSHKGPKETPQGESPAATGDKNTWVQIPQQAFGGPASTGAPMYVNKDKQSKQAAVSPTGPNGIQHSLTKKAACRQGKGLMAQKIRSQETS